ncbi:hypothetical protein D7X55_19565 [Corallococcus sp. AB049A]|uniref:Uncharacterized protein n=1 Tax=Corallococcus interemptor TaxID=2316720 RepID=A0A3A8PU79_9BACT|nr:MULTISPECIES: hypothetical protein [Corallococcus]RKH59518.1 hypothetical protein D7X96_35250 [Corallococcus interemptor]RKI63669.1 hypothetical protein D7X55_19565 [Corallococcus sp. AB049A]
MNAWVVSGAVSFALGAYLRRRDARGPSGGVIDRRRLTPLQITYSLLLAYPFCAAYVALDLSLGS